LSLRRGVLKWLRKSRKQAGRDAWISFDTIARFGVNRWLPTISRQNAANDFL